MVSIATVQILPVITARPIASAGHFAPFGHLRIATPVFFTISMHWALNLCKTLSTQLDLKLRHDPSTWKDQSFGTRRMLGIH